MKKLYILGNGFDLAHKIKSRYSDFKEFLETNYGCVEDDQWCMPEISILPDGTVQPNLNICAKIIYKLIENLSANDSGWNQFEEYLGWFNYNELKTLLDVDNDNLFTNAYIYEDYAVDIKQCVLCISELFKEWLNQISIDNIYKVFCFDDSDLFLTFNYTNTLEDVYGIKEENICHIHGKKGENLIIGHCYNINEGQIYEENLYEGNADITFNEIKQLLKKDTENQININKSFFEKLKSEDSLVVIVFGHSYSKVDQIYFEKIASNRVTNWFLGWYDDKDKTKANEFKDALKLKNAEVINNEEIKAKTNKIVKY